MPKPHKGRVLPDLSAKKPWEDLPKSPVEARMEFATDCCEAVIPGADEDLAPKRVIFDAAARWGIEQPECPATHRTIGKLRTYIRNHWPVIRLMLTERNIVPVYVNGTEFGAGGGYRVGDKKAVQKQIERDERVAQGVVDSADAYAQAAVGVFPKVAANRYSLRLRAIS